MITREQIDAIVASQFNVTVRQLRSQCRKQDIIFARAAAMLLCNMILKASSKKLCRMYGKSAFSTTLNALKVARNLLETDKTFRKKFEAALANCNEPAKLIKQRYNLHYRVRAKGIKLNCKTKTVSVNQEQAEMLRDSQTRKLLDKHNYAIQFSII